MMRTLREKLRSPALKKPLRVLGISAGLTVFFALVMSVTAHAAGVSIDVNAADDAGGLGALEVIFIFAFLSLLPSILMMMTSFTRIIIVLGFLRNAMGTAQSPPNMVLIGLAFFLSLFIMAPVLEQINEEAYQPYVNNQMEAAEAIEAAIVPLKRFMLREASPESLRNFIELSGSEVPEVADPGNPVELLELSLPVIVSAFIASELTRAFVMGFLIFLPFLVIDITVSSILMSMGMVMLPPAMISLPFKLLLFILVDGWNLTMGTLARSFSPMG